MKLNWIYDFLKSMQSVRIFFNFNNTTDSFLIELTARSDHSLVCGFGACVTCTDP